MQVNSCCWWWWWWLCLTTAAPNTTGTSTSSSRNSHPRLFVAHLYHICIYLWLSVLIIFSFNFLWLEILHGIKCIMLLKCWLVPNFTRHCTVFKLKLKNSTKLCGNLFLCFKEKPRFWSFFLRVSRCGAFCKSTNALSAQLSMEPNSTWGCN